MISDIRLTDNTSGYIAILFLLMNAKYPCDFILSKKAPSVYQNKGEAFILDFNLMTLPLYGGYSLFIINVRNDGRFLERYSYNDLIK